MKQYSLRKVYLLFSSAKSKSKDPEKLTMREVEEVPQPRCLVVVGGYARTSKGYRAVITNDALLQSSSL